MTIDVVEVTYGQKPLDEACRVRELSRLPGDALFLISEPYLGLPLYWHSERGITHKTTDHFVGVLSALPTARDSRFRILCTGQPIPAPVYEDLPPIVAICLDCHNQFPAESMRCTRCHSVNITEERR